MSQSTSTAGRWVAVVMAVLLSGVIGLGAATRSASAATTIDVPPPTASASAGADGFLDGFLDSFSVGFLDGFLDSQTSGTQRASLAAATESSVADAEQVILAAAEQAGVTVRKVKANGKKDVKVKTEKLSEEKAQAFIDALKASQGVAFANSDG